MIWSFLGFFSLAQSIPACNVLIKSDVRNLQPRNYIKLLRWNGTTYSATDSIQAGSVNNLQTGIEKPEIAFLEIGRNKAIPIFLTPETFFLSGDATRHKSLMIKGNSEQTIYNRYTFLLDAFDKRMENLDFEREQAQRLNKINEVKRLSGEMQIVIDERSAFMKKFAQNNASSLVSAYIAKTILPSLTLSELESLVRVYTEKNLDDPIIEELRNRLTILQNTTVGKVISDFNFTVNSTGKTVSIRDFKGKYTLIYFWASWCNYCLKENSTLLNLHETYKDRGFEIIAISLDSDKLRWQKKVKEDSLSDWVHVCDFLETKSPLIQSFGVTNIPMAFLLDIDNVIIGNVGVLQELESTLQHLLGIDDEQP